MPLPLYLKCRGCGQREDDHFDLLGHSCCDKSEFGGRLCFRCSDQFQVVNCAVCGDCFCKDHGYHIKNECCGLLICGKRPESRHLSICYSSDSESDGEPDEFCFDKHKVYKDPKCGHYRCNLYKEGCRMCIRQGKARQEILLMVEDKKLLVDLVKKMKSKVSQQRLVNLIKTFPGEKKVVKKKNAAVKSIPPKSAAPPKLPPAKTLGKPFNCPTCSNKEPHKCCNIFHCY
jgi:hypothetical protein